MEAGSAAGARDFDHLREHLIGLPGVLFQAISHIRVEVGRPERIYVEDETVVAPTATPVAVD